jgi:hypothetical protein
LLVETAFVILWPGEFYHDTILAIQPEKAVQPLGGGGARSDIAIDVYGDVGDLDHVSKQASAIHELEVEVVCSSDAHTESPTTRPSSLAKICQGTGLYRAKVSQSTL